MPTHLPTSDGKSFREEGRTGKIELEAGTHYTNRKTGGSGPAVLD